MSGEQTGAGGMWRRLKPACPGVNPWFLGQEIAKNLRLENFRSVILMGLRRNSNSRFAIRNVKTEGQRQEIGA